MDKSWMLTDRTQKPYMDGVTAFLNYAVSSLKKSTNIDPLKTKQKIKIPCPCINCLNHYSLPLDEVDAHLFTKGIDPNYTRWIKHGEIDEPAKNVFHSEFFETDVPADAPETIEMVKATEDNFPKDYKKFQALLADAEKPLYEGCPNFTKLSALVQLLNLKSKHGISDRCFSELLVLLKSMLPEGNEMVEKTYEAKKIMKAMGSGYTKIDVCVNDCILYRKEYKDLMVCPTCGESRWKVDKKTKKMYENVPAKVMWYFPIIPRLKRLFQAKNTAEDFRWHATSSKKPGVLRHPSDSPAWQTINDRFPEIANDPRNLRLGISTDGVDVNRGNRNHSVWPVLAVIYNLPPWLCMKRKFIMLSLLISGAPENDIDVFLDPLIDDLELLFEEGVETYDTYAQEKFTLRAVVLWTINDYPALGTLCGCPYSGFHGCVVCRKETHCCRLPFSAKQSYAGHRRYLPYNHPFRKQTKAFNGKEEWGNAPDPLTGEEIFNEVKYVKNKWGKGFKDQESEILETSTGRGGKTIKRKRKTSKGGSTSNSGLKEQTYWKKFNIWYRRLRYWRYNCVQHCLDFMHIEKNVAESIVGTLLNVPGKTKDGLPARLDLAHFGLKQELQATTEGNKTILPPACYTLTKDEKDKFCETLYNLKVPQGKEIRVEELDKLQEELCVTLCLLEKYFPPSFFDVMVHLVVHLTREVKLCGPICFRWMYPFERCMKVIKGDVRNKTYPEGCIAEENIAEETIEFFSEYQKNMKTIGIPPNKHDTSENNHEGNLLSAGKPDQVSPELFLKAHFYVLQNTPEVEPYVEQHMTFLKNQHSGKRKSWLQKEHSMTFGHWLRNKVAIELAASKDSVSETVKWISHGAHNNVVKYDAYYINGYTFRTKSREGRVYQNSGVGVEATDMHISKEVVTYGQNFYYGVLQEIWVLDYHIRKIPLFMCDWVENKKGVRQDNLGYTLVELNRLGHKDDPFILASQARQVFYVQDQLDKKRSIVFMTPPKNYRDSYDDVDEESSTVIFPHNDNILPRVDPRDLGNESRNDYFRTDCNGIVLRNVDRTLS